MWCDYRGSSYFGDNSFVVIPAVPELWTAWNYAVCGPNTEHCRDKDREKRQYLWCRAQYISSCTQPAGSEGSAEGSVVGAPCCNKNSKANDSIKTPAMIEPALHTSAMHIANRFCNSKLLVFLVPTLYQRDTSITISFNSYIKQKN